MTKLDYRCVDNTVEWVTKEGRMKVEIVTSSIFRCLYTKGETFSNASVMITERQKEVTPFEVEETREALIIKSSRLKLVVEKENGHFSWFNPKTGKLYVAEAGKQLTATDIIHYTTGEEAPIIDRVKTVDGERNFIRNLKPKVDRKAYRGKVSFNWQGEEGIYGLGQGEEGVYNYRGHNQYLYQHNMRIPIPMFVSSNCYGVLFDCCSLMTFNDDHNGSYIFMDAIEQMDYYFMVGEKMDDIIDGYRLLTGKATMLPKWTFGYVQSKEAYHTGEELVEVVKQYRDLKVPLDCIVQDWDTWESGKWGQKTVDKTRYPRLKENIDAIHAMNVHTMVSIWPNMNPGVDNHTAFFEKGYLLNDYSTYNAFSEEARALYFEQANEELFSSGFDSWWCDSTEPFSGPDWGGEVTREPWERYTLVGEEHKKYLDATKANAFALEHARGMYENQRKITEEKRVVNLTRSGYSGSQKYGTILWSGDTCASWENFRKQIVEGLSFALSGMPYWTLDIGAFFTVGTAWQNRGCGNHNNPNPLWFWQGHYNDGVKDDAYKELYVRWLQYGVFLPMFRSHGTDTPREIWHFGKKGEMFYDAIEKYINLRYQLMPYVYSLAGQVHLNNSTMLRSFLFDFLEDEEARKIEDSFMFGPSLLVCPVTWPMYYEVGSRAIEKEKTRRCYLPKSVGWYDYWTGKYKEGGQWVNAKADLDTMPLFVKAGSIVPTIEGLQYADEKVEEPIKLTIYPGGDAYFELYEDEGDNYNFEKGAYTLIPMRWDEEEKELVIEKRIGSYEGMEAVRTFKIGIVGKEEKVVSYAGEEMSMSFDDCF